MSQLFDLLFGQYAGYSTIDIVLENVAVLFGLISVLYAKKNSVLVYPTGLISTIIFIYILIKCSLLGDLVINGYYFVMSIYGWHLWSRKRDDKDAISMARTTNSEKITTGIIFILAIFFITGIYIIFNKFNNWTAYVDTLTTAIFFSGMWLMAKRKIENWIFWIIGDAISVPLYFYKGLTFSSIMYVLFTFFAIMGYLTWRKSIAESNLLKSSII